MRRAAAVASVIRQQPVFLHVTGTLGTKFPPIKTTSQRSTTACALRVIYTGRKQKFAIFANSQKMYNSNKNILKNQPASTSSILIYKNIRDCSDIVQLLYQHQRWKERCNSGRSLWIHRAHLLHIS